MDGEWCLTATFLGILAAHLVLGRFTLPVLFDVLGPDRKWEREKREVG